ncbi:MAG: hypothetical protein C0501_08960 [Isosphaera sp.]|nr:hypothetical protein [Isosphaera sp.]
MRVLSAGKREVVAVGFAPGGAALVGLYDWDGAFVWDPGSADPPRRCLPAGHFYPRALVFTPAGGLVRPAGPRLVAVDPATGDRSPLGPVADRSPVNDFALADGRVVLQAGSWHAPSLSAWHPAGDGWRPGWAEDVGGQAGGLALSPAGDRLAYLRLRSYRPWRYELAVRDAATGDPVAARDYPYRSFRRLHFRPDGRQLVAVCEMTLLVWDLDRDGPPRAVRNDSRKHFTAAAFHPSGRHLFTTSNDTTVTVWDAATWSPVARYTWEVGRLRSVAVSPDGAVAAAGSDKGQVVVWDVDL